MTTWRAKSRGFATCLCRLCASASRGRALAKRLRVRDIRHTERREIAEATS